MSVAIILVVTDTPQRCGVAAASAYSNMINVFIYKDYEMEH